MNHPMIPRSTSEIIKITLCAEAIVALAIFGSIVLILTGVLK